MNMTANSSTTNNFERLMGEIMREAVIDPKAADWCVGSPCNERVLDDTTQLYADFKGENPMPISREYSSGVLDRDLKIIALVYVRNRDSVEPTEDRPNKFYFVDLDGVVLLQTVPVPYPAFLRLIDDEEIGQLADVMATL